MFVKIGGLIVKPTETPKQETDQMNTNTNTNNPESATEVTDNTATEARDVAATDTTADAATAASEADTDADSETDADGEAENATGATQITADKLTDLASFGRVAKIAEAVQQAAAEALEAIREDAEGLQNAADISAEAADARKDLWANTLSVVGVIADATKEAPEYRGLIYNFVMGEFMTEKTRSTAKAYASTGRNVLVKLLTERKVPLADVQAASYSEVRTMLNPPSAEQAEARKLVDGIKKQLGIVARFGDKYGNEAAAVRLARIAEAVEREYNPVARAKEADTSKEKAAREVADLRQTSPRESGNVETVKPEAPRVMRTLHKAGSVNARH